MRNMVRRVVARYIGETRVPEDFTEELEETFLALYKGKSVRIPPDDYEYLKDLGLVRPSSREDDGPYTDRILLPSGKQLAEDCFARTPEGKKEMDARDRERAQQGNIEF